MINYKIIYIILLILIIIHYSDCGSVSNFILLFFNSFILYKNNLNKKVENNKLINPNYTTRFTDEEDSFTFLISKNNPQIIKQSDLNI